MAEVAALEWSADNCMIERALGVIGDRWSLLVLREVFEGIRRFDDLTVRTAIPRQVLTDRLRRLVAAGVLRREPYRASGQRMRHEYRLTDQGLDLYPVLIALQEWGNRHLVGPEGPALEFFHRDCGEPVKLVVRCRAGHELESPRRIGGRPGAGARRVSPGSASPAGSGTGRRTASPPR
jgi:DNA-binding HxlR family transcriptional regulator